MSTNGKQENQNNHGNAEKLFRAMSGIDEELLARSEQSTADAGAKRGKVHRFPVWKTSRIVAACLCFGVVGAVFVTVSTYGWRAGKSANSTGAAQSADMAVQNEAAAAPEEVLSAAATADEDTLDGVDAAAQSADVAESAEDATAPVGNETAMPPAEAREAVEMPDGMEAAQQEGTAGNADTSAQAETSGDLEAVQQVAPSPEQNASGASRTEAASANPGDEQKQALQQDAGADGAAEQSVSDNDSTASGETSELREKAPRRPHRKMIKRTTRG